MLIGVVLLYWLQWFRCCDDDNDNYVGCAAMNGRTHTMDDSPQNGFGWQPDDVFLLLGVHYSCESSIVYSAYIVYNIVL